jgi:hypothetical protein
MRRLLLFAVLSGIPVLSEAASTINTTNAYAWGANIGWTNWRPSATDGVVIGEFVCSGYVWGANVGWIHMGDGTPTNNIQYSNTSGTDYGINYSVDSPQPGYGILRGLAYGANIGWINFEATGNPRVRFTDGALEGYAYSANCGWINLGDMSQHNLKTDHIAMGTDSDGDGMADAFEYLSFGGLGHTGTADSDGDGMSDLQEYQEGTVPTQANAGLRITNILKNPPPMSSTSTDLTWSSTTGRLYSIETTLDLTIAFAPDGTYGTPFAPDAGISTTKMLVESSSTKRYFRVKSVRPLP